MSFVGQKINTSSDNFAALVRDQCLLVDKTLMIKEFMTGTTVSLVTRPRRFGKTLALSMLHCFLSNEVAGMSTVGLFDAFSIAKEENGEKHQGQYPVIFISFKDTKKPSYEATVSHISSLIKQLYGEHRKCLHASELEEDEKALFRGYLDGSLDATELQSSLAFLSMALFKVYGKKAFILIDEYDSPLTNAYQHTPKHLISSEDGFLYQLSNFMRDLFSAALKTNPYLEKGLMTGILRISKSSMLSGLNNLEVYTLLENEYAAYFGFTETEVEELLHYKKSDTSLDAVRSLYNGYKIGDQIIYNPWSFMHFLNKKELMPYWVATSNDRILHDQFIGSNEETKELIKMLMLNQSIVGDINVNVNYEDLMEKPSALWTLLLFCGYLTIESRKLDPVTLRWVCCLRIPNREIQSQYNIIFLEWLKNHVGSSRYASLLSSLMHGQVAIFIRSLSDYLMASLCFHDIVGKKSEKFYHGFVLGLIASVRETHFVSSNGESGTGRYDVMLIPKDARYSAGGHY